MIVERQLSHWNWGKIMKMFLLFAAILFWTFPVKGQTSVPLNLIQTIELPGVPKGPIMEHVEVDLKNHRLFATPESQHAVQVVDLDAGKAIHQITGIGVPHSVVYRSDIDRIYVTDGDPGLIRIYDGHDYHQVSTIKLLFAADDLAYDRATKYLYATNGGHQAHLDYSLLSVINSDTGEHLFDYKATGGFGHMRFEKSTPRMYINLEGENKVAVIDREKRTIVETWSIPKSECKGNGSMALDELHHRLFIGCRNSDMHGSIVVLDTETGKDVATLPIGGILDDLEFDAASGRILAPCGTGEIYVFQQLDRDHYELDAKVDSAVLGKNGLLVPELHRFFVPLPHLTGGADIGRVLVYEVR
jgi:DNA-binding beta-propeller fold protein YncE